MGLGGCSGILPGHPVGPLVVPLGAVFYVRAATEMDGTLDYPIPVSSNEMVTRSARRGPIAQYHATHVGSGYLIAHGTTYCEGIDPRRGSCPILEVRVRRS